MGLFYSFVATPFAAHVLVWNPQATETPVAITEGMAIAIVFTRTISIHEAHLLPGNEHQWCYWGPESDCLGLFKNILGI